MTESELQLEKTMNDYNNAIIAWGEAINKKLDAMIEIQEKLVQKISTL